MNELSLFTGAGGGIWGTKLLGWRCLGYVENNDYCQRVIAQRIADGHFEPAPTFGDIQAFLDQGYARRYRGVAEVVTAGFPCTPWSVAGKRRGEADSRNLWPATIATIREVRPRFAYLENVPALLANRDFGRILGDLAESGYGAKWCVLGADDVGAPHRRKRLWILAHAQHGGRCEGGEATGRTEGVASDRLCEGGEAGVADANGGRQLQSKGAVSHQRGRVGNGSEEVADSECEGRQGRVQEAHEGRTRSEQRSKEVADAERKGLEKREGVARNDGQEQPTAERSCDSTQEMAHANEERRDGRSGMQRSGRGVEPSYRCSWWDIDPADLGDANEGRLPRDTWGRPGTEFENGCCWPVESRVGRVVNGLAIGATGLQPLAKDRYLRWWRLHGGCCREQ